VNPSPIRTSGAGGISRARAHVERGAGRFLLDGVGPARARQKCLNIITTATIINNNNYEMVETCNNIIHILYSLRRRTPLRSTAEAL